MRALSCLLALGLALAWPALVSAQESEIETQFKKVSPEEEARLKAILAEPLQTDALKTTLQRQINQKRMAAKRLSMPELEEPLLREALPWCRTSACKTTWPFFTATVGTTSRR